MSVRISRIAALPTRSPERVRPAALRPDRSAAAPPSALGNQAVQRLLSSGTVQAGLAIERMAPRDAVLRQPQESPRGRLTEAGRCDEREILVQDPPPCRFTEGERIALEEARQIAARRARSAHRLWTGQRGPLWQSYGRGLARRIFELPQLPTQHITDTLDHLATRLEDRGLPMVCAPCRDRDCFGGLGAYVAPSRQPPIHICPLFFSESYQRHTASTLIHEVAHLEGVDTQRTPPETYCKEGDPCTAPCHGIDVADAWGHFVSCYGTEAPTAFNPRPMRTVRSVQEAH
jgi:lysine-specific metallo-endopeptidase family protein